MEKAKMSSARGGHNQMRSRLRGMWRHRLTDAGSKRGKRPKTMIKLNRVLSNQSIHYVFACNQMMV